MCNNCVSAKTAEFILKANNKQGVGTWGYGKTVYINNRTQVIIT